MYYYDVAFVLLASLLVVLAIEQGLGIVIERSKQALRREQMTKPVPKSINLNEMAKRIAVLEGGKTQVNIAQIKEVLRITLDLLAKENISSVVTLLAKRDDQWDNIYAFRIWGDK